MKIKTEHYAILESAINDVLSVHNANGELVRCYESGDFHKSDAVKDLQKRFCFDVLFGAGLNKFVCSELYPYMDDNHLYTALKSICPKVIKRY